VLSTPPLRVPPEPVKNQLHHEPSEQYPGDTVPCSRQPGLNAELVKEALTTAACMRSFRNPNTHPTRSARAAWRIRQNAHPRMCEARAFVSMRQGAVLITINSAWINNPHEGEGRAEKQVPWKLMNPKVAPMSHTPAKAPTRRDCRADNHRLDAAVKLECQRKADHEHRNQHPPG